MTITTNVDADAERRIGEQIRRARLFADVDQETLAARANISVGALRNLELGKGSRLVTLIGALRALGKDSWLDTLEPEVEPGPFDEVYGRREPQRASRRKGSN
jgi:transcriptional regulator with XRE-family HTH domain